MEGGRGYGLEEGGEGGVRKVESCEGALLRIFFKLSGNNQGKNDQISRRENEKEEKKKKFFFFIFFLFPFFNFQN